MVLVCEILKTNITIIYFLVLFNYGSIGPFLSVPTQKNTYHILYAVYIHSQKYWDVIFLGYCPRLDWKESAVWSIMAKRTAERFNLEQPSSSWKPPKWTTEEDFECWRNLIHFCSVNICHKTISEDLLQDAMPKVEESGYFLPVQLLWPMRNLS